MLLVTFFLILSILVDEFLFSSITFICKKLYLSEGIAGVTLVAFGNGAPDLFASIFGSVSNTIAMYNQLVGGALFLTMCVGGIIVSVRPFNLQVGPTLRDIVVLIPSIIFIRSFTTRKLITLGESIALISIYGVYIIIACTQFVLNKLEEEVVHVTVNPRSTVALNGRRLSDPIETCSSLFKDFCYHMNPISKEWSALKWYSKMYIIIMYVPMIVIKLVYPVVSLEYENHGWCKLLAMINVQLSPICIIMLLNCHMVYVCDTIPLLAVGAVVGTILVIIVYCSSEQYNPPKCHILFAILCFILCMTAMYRLVKEIYSILCVFGILFRIYRETMCLTVLALGNNMPDAITNVSIARKGFQRMAFSACFGSALFNILLGMGTTILVKHFSLRDNNVEIRAGTMGPVCSFFLVLGSSYCLFFILLTNFQARKSFGSFLIFIYVLFLLYCLLCESHIIHPLGTDHQAEVAAENMTEKTP